MFGKVNVYDKVIMRSGWGVGREMYAYRMLIVPPGTPVSSTNETDCHDITEILLKVALSSITLTHPSSVLYLTVHMI